MDPKAYPLRRSIPTWTRVSLQRSRVNNSTAWSSRSPPLIADLLASTYLRPQILQPPSLKQNARCAMLTEEHLLSIPAHICSVRTAWHLMCNPNSKPVDTPSFVRYALGVQNIQHIPVVCLNRNYRINGLSRHSRLPLAIRKNLLTDLKITNDQFPIFKELERLHK
jgi:hypothetical protein